MEQLDELIREAEAVLEKAAKSHDEALIAVVRLKVQRDMLFLASGDKSIVDREFGRH